ncbi:Gfo/Idh/MocA family protein [Candidatus Poriferisocius sp.]|uniref:Gfo/Idh/MocA family protein n=1 Tax=Candidatus Poriferisocius sp. TaxID=3101276 RepID=UPI003B01689C
MIRYGVIGTGMMGREHIANLSRLPGAEVTALADPHPPSLEAAESLAPGARRFSHCRDLLAADACDAVVICTPNMTHVDVLGDVLGTDLHVLVEKPLCTTVADCRRVIDAAAGHRGVIRVGLEYRYMAPFARLIDEVQAGAVGRVRMVSMREHRFPFLSKVGDWNRFGENTGGTLVEKCCHFFDLMNLVMPGRPERVFASGGQAVNHLDERFGDRVPDIDDNAYVVVDYDDGARAMLDLCMFAEATHNQQEFAVVGDAGKAEALVPEHIVRIGRRGRHSIGDVEVVKTPVEAPYRGFHHGSSFVEHQRFLEAVEAGDCADSRARSIQALEAALLCVAMGVAGQQSMATGLPVAIADISP